MQRNKISDEVKELLRIAYVRFENKFDQLLQKYLFASGEVDDLVRLTRDQLSSGGWDTIKANLPESLASVFAVWSISYSKTFYLNSKNKNSILRPHPIQVRYVL